jgi:hypothetical protein
MHGDFAGNDETRTTMNNDAMTAAYIEAIYFTETGDSGQPDADAQLSEQTRHEAWAACHRLRLACTGHRGIDLTQFDAAQIGHDLWLTRNGHGAGFWDRPEIYGADNARVLTLMARAMGEHDAEFGGAA